MSSVGAGLVKLGFCRLVVVGAAICCTAVPDSVAAGGPLQATACWFPVPDGMAVDCGYLEVGVAGRGGPGRHRLAVVVLRSSAAKPADDPVVYLHGGPGSAVLGAAEERAIRLADWWYLTEGLRRTRNVVLYDQRGVGLSEPSADCPELDALAAGEATRGLARAGVRRLERDAASRCAARLAQGGLDFASLSTSANADDVATLAAALGASRLSLVATSYGTRVALEVMRRHPRLVRAAVLDSPYPPQVAGDAEEPAHAARAFRRLFDDCAADADCRAAFPDLEQGFRAFVERLQANPVRIEFPTGDGGDATEGVLLDGRSVVEGLFTAFYDAAELPLLPTTIATAMAGDLSVLAELVPLPHFATPSDAEGAALAIGCAEDWARVDRQALARAAAAHAPYGLIAAANPHAELCEAWPLRARRDYDPRPVESAVPTLLLTGAYDPVTPPDWARLAAATLSRAVVSEYAAVGHAVIESHPCAIDEAVAFIENAGAAPLPACSDKAKLPRFVAERPNAGTR